MKVGWNHESLSSRRERDFNQAPRMRTRSSSKRVRRSVVLSQETRRKSSPQQMQSRVRNLVSPSVLIWEERYLCDYIAQSSMSPECDLALDSIKHMSVFCDTFGTCKGQKGIWVSLTTRPVPVSPLASVGSSTVELVSSELRGS